MCHVCTSFFSQPEYHKGHKRVLFYDPVMLFLDVFITQCASTMQRLCALVSRIQEMEPNTNEWSLLLRRPDVRRASWTKRVDGHQVKPQWKCVHVFCFPSRSRDVEWALQLQWPSQAWPTDSWDVKPEMVWVGRKGSGLMHRLRYMGKPQGCYSPCLNSNYISPQKTIQMGLKYSTICLVIKMPIQTCFCL